MSTKTQKAHQIKSTVLRVNDNTFAIPSQTREKKAHIVTMKYKTTDVLIPNSLLIEARDIMSENNTSSATVNERRKHNLLMVLWNLAEEEIEFTCTCEDHTYHPTEKCKHILAVELYLNEQ